MDALTQNSGNGRNNRLVPPVYLILKVVKELVFYRCKETLVIPRWPDSDF